jgi:hypothetical protein
MPNKFKDVTVGERTFRLSKMPATDADWVKNQLVFAFCKDMKSSGEQTEQPEPTEQWALDLVKALWIKGGVVISRETYTDIQAICLRACASVNDGVAGGPIMMVDGRWADQTVKDDVKTVSDLIVQSLQFNLLPFFYDGPSGNSASPSSNPPNAQR